MGKPTGKLAVTTTTNVLMEVDNTRRSLPLTLSLSFAVLPVRVMIKQLA